MSMSRLHKVSFLCLQVCCTLFSVSSFCFFFFFVSFPVQSRSMSVNGMTSLTFLPSFLPSFQSLPLFPLVFFPFRFYIQIKNNSTALSKRSTHCPPLPFLLLLLLLPLLLPLPTSSSLSPPPLPHLQSSSLFRRRRCHRLAPLRPPHSLLPLLLLLLPPPHPPPS